MDKEQKVFIDRINGKQLDAFRELYDDFYRSLVYFACNYVGRREVAEDIVQEVMVKVWENTATYPSCNSLKTFLYTAVRNACLDYYRHQKAEGRYLAQLEFQEPEDLDLKIMEEELYRSLLRVIEELPMRCKEIFQLHLSGLKNEEIAVRLHLSVATVKTQKKKAMSYLRKRLNGGFFLLLAFHII